tara:strand:+ start:361 stop:558 length:198 start_codon:yes stop_codon:yes gene_type:complete
MMDRLFTRDNITWTLGIVVALLGYLGAHTSLCPPQYVDRVQDISGLIGVVSAYLKASPAPHSMSL